MKYLFLFLLIPSLAFADELTFSWDPNPEQDIAGYKIYMGSEAGKEGTVPILSVGVVTTAKFTITAPGKYYFVLTAFNTSNLESIPSEEISATISPKAPGQPKNFSLIQKIAMVIEKFLHWLSYDA